MEKNEDTCFTGACVTPFSVSLEERGKVRFLLPELSVESSSQVSARAVSGDSLIRRFTVIFYRLLLE